MLDFGIAKLLADSDTAHETQLTQLSGRALTPDYASPEQIKGEPLTIATDIYSLGVVLYELLVGQRPYRLKVKSAAQLEQAIVDAEPQRPSSAATADAADGARSTTSHADSTHSAAISTRSCSRRSQSRLPNVIRPLPSSRRTCVTMPPACRYMHSRIVALPRGQVYGPQSCWRSVSGAVVGRVGRGNRCLAVAGARRDATDIVAQREAKRAQRCRHFCSTVSDQYRRAGGSAEGARYDCARAARHRRRRE